MEWGMRSSRFTISNSLKGAAFFSALALVAASIPFLRTKRFHQPCSPPGAVATETEERDGPPPPEFLKQQWGGFANPPPVATSTLAAASAPLSNWQQLGP